MGINKKVIISSVVILLLISVFFLYSSLNKTEEPQQERLVSNEDVEKTIVKKDTPEPVAEALSFSWEKDSN